MGRLVELVFYMYSADGTNYQCFICKCTEKHLKKVPFGTLSTLTICYSLFCQSATPEVLALSCLRICFKIILSLAERCLGIDLRCQGAVNSGLFTSLERVKMPQRASDKPQKADSNTY